MDDIDWNDRMIGIKGTRGVGKTTFLLQEKYLPTAIFPLGSGFYGIEGIIDEYHVAVVSP